MRTSGGVGNFIARLIRIVAGIICTLLVLRIIFALISVNDGNAIVSFIDDWADHFAWKFRDLFAIKDEATRILVNYGIATVVYQVVAGLLVKFFRRGD